MKLQILVSEKNLVTFLRDFFALFLPLSREYVRDDVKSVLRIFSAHNKNNCRNPTVGTLIKLKL